MKTLAVLFALIVSGCGFTEQGNLIRSAVAERGADAYDEAIVNSMWMLCYGASIGSVDRMFGRSPETAETYKAFCAIATPDPDVGIVKPAPK